MGKKKYYGIKSPDSIRGIYENWEEVKSLVKGVNAIYKGFSTIEDVEEFVYERTNPIYEDKYLIFVDGSFNNNKVGSAFAIIKNNKILAEDSFVYQNKFNGNNIEGELNALIYSLNKAISMELKEVILFHDLEMTSHLYNGDWNGKKPSTIEFQKIIKENKYKDKIKVDFVKVVSHTNKKWNEYVDKLAYNITL